MTRLALIALLATTFPAGAAEFLPYGASAKSELPIRARIIRCITQEEIRAACEEGLCCEMLEEGGFQEAQLIVE